MEGKNLSPINKKIVKRHFDRHAGTYDQFAIIQRYAAEQLLRMLDASVTNASASMRILEIGCGTGYVTERLAVQYPQARVVALDMAPAMLQATRQRLHDHHGENVRSRIEYVCADAEEWVQQFPQMCQNSHVSKVSIDSGKFDLIISSAAFQWFNEPRETAMAYWRLLNPGGYAAFSTYGPDTFTELHQSFAEAEAALGLPRHRHGQRFPALSDWARWQSEAGLEPLWMQEEHAVEWHSSVDAFLRAVQKTGASSASTSPGSGRLSRALLRNMKAYYERHFGAEQTGEVNHDARIQATSHLLWVGGMKDHGMSVKQRSRK
ncbi:methyltransferase domain-containing protein [Marinicrinis sediminis]|uniref:Malonyl-[acyl-carrier protein] O-methyltransferase n=1 Tax=Marinicrinis sediminis TaxID=1652465 RepID=A0ABW5RHK1_9BACL